MRSLRRLLAARLVVVVGLVVVVTWQATGERRALAAPTAEAQRLRAARTHYEKAVSHYNLDELEDALVEFREAYRIKPDPSFLFNIAQCYRKLGQWEAAVDFYRKYVRASPDASNRAEAERRIAELKARSDDLPLAAPATVPATAAPIDLSPAMPAAISPPPSPSSSSSSSSSSASAAPLAPTMALDVSSNGRPAAATPSPFYRRWWFWTALGALAAGAVVTAITLGSTSPSPYAGNIPPGTARVPTN